MLESILCILQPLLPRQGFAECQNEQEDRTLWSWTAKGMHEIRAQFMLVAPRNLLRPRAGLPRSEMTELELLLVLQDEGWECLVRWPKGQDRVGMPAVEAYEYGGAKRWWMKHSATNASKPYMLCLLLASEAEDGVTVPVQHFAPQYWYEALLSGGPLPSLKRGRRGKGGQADDEFDVMNCETNAEATFKYASRRAPRASRRAAGPQPQVAMDASSEDSGDGGRRSETASVAAKPSAGQDASRQAGSSSSCSGFDDDATSSESSSRSSQSSQSSPVTLPASAPAGATVTIDGQERAAEEQPERAHPGGGRILETTTFWKGCKLTMVKQRGAHVGWEATCNLKKHRADNRRCRRTLRFRKRSDESEILCELKHWYLCGLAPDCRTLEQHQGLPRGGGGDVTEQALDARVVPGEWYDVSRKRHRDT